MREPILISNPVGVDRAIQDLQIYLIQYLTWLGKAYGRAYIRDKTPFVYMKNKEYHEVYGNDKSNSFCFFDLNPIVKRDQEGNTNRIITQTANISIIFFVNLKKCFNLLHRSDENAICEVIDKINMYFSNYGEWTLQNTIRTVEKVYSNFNYTQPESLIDDEPYTVFSLEFELKYTNEQIC